MEERRSVHRESEVTTLTKLIDSPPAPGLSIVGISGLGGVGKTFLLDHVFWNLDVEKKHLVLRADGSNADTRDDFFGLIDGQLFRRSLPPPAAHGLDYFPRIRKVASTYRNIVESAMKEIEKQGAPESVKRVAKCLLVAGKVLNANSKTNSKNMGDESRKAQGKAHKYLDLLRQLKPSEVDLALDAAFDVISGLKGLQDKTYLLPGPARDLLGITFKNRVRNDLYSLTASELRSDLSAALVGYEKTDKYKMLHGRIPGIERLILVFDDYEAIHPLIDEFLVGGLVPELAAARFQTLMIILGRDDFENTHPGWLQHCRPYIRNPIRLAPFSETAASALMAEAGIPEERWNELFKSTQGYPFLLSLVIEEAASNGNSVIFLRRFYDRTTRWMTEVEKNWFLRICYLDRVNEDTLQVMFPVEELAIIQRIQDWFEREASIRDPDADYFRIRPLIREKMLRYQEVKSPSRHRESVAMAEKALSSA